MTAMAGIGFMVTNQPGLNAFLLPRQPSSRDVLVTRTLRRNGRRVPGIWEHELASKNEGRLVVRLRRMFGQ